MTGLQEAGTGLAAIRAEMARQHADARRSLDAAAAMAGRVADSVRRTGRLRLVGMGGSHCVNRCAEAVLRGYGIDAAAVVASEALYAPFPSGPATTVLTSQSGGSAEIVRGQDGPRNRVARPRSCGFSSGATSPGASV